MLRRYGLLDNAMIYIVSLFYIAFFNIMFNNEINKSGMTVIAVSKDANVASFCQRTIRLHNGNIISEESNVRA